MLRYVTFAIKVQLNVHDLNNEAVAGNVTDIRIMDFLNENGDRVEAPAVSGRMLKHWHYEAMREIGLDLPFCDACKIGEPVRPAVIVSDNGQKKLSHQEAINKGTTEVIKSCMICDVHGYLAAIGTTSERRSSRVMFSWLMPVFGSKSEAKQVIHSRVRSGMDFKEAELTSQMPYSKSYASGIYAFVSALDIERIGLVELNLGSEQPYAIEVSARKQRAKMAIQAYRHLISGQIGASLSHAMPHTKPIEILVAYSENGALPFPVSPVYQKYIEDTVGLMPEHAKLLYWGEKSPEGVEKRSSIDEIFQELIKKMEEAKQ